MTQPDPIKTIEEILIAFGVDSDMHSDSFELLVDALTTQSNKELLKAQWATRVGEAAWWHKHLHDPNYKELLETRYSKMKERYEATLSADSNKEDTE